MSINYILRNEQGSAQAEMGRAACEVTDYLAGEGVDGREYFVLIA